jgi:manganese-dependent ADP-ribose/CDP-alcohol diphosphatase
VRLLVLDPYAIAMMTPDEGPTRAAARAILRTHNPNNVEGQGDWTVGLPSDKRHFVPYNGALGEAQLAWLRAEVASAAAAGERVIVLTHAPLHPGACERSTMPWDYELALAALRGDGAPSTVVAVLSGHDHNGGFARDDDGVLHVTFQSPLNKGDDGDAYGIVELAGDELVLHGPRLADWLPAALLPTGHVDGGVPVRLELRASAPAVGLADA